MLPAAATTLIETDILECLFLRGCYAFNSVLQNVLLKLMDRLNIKEYFLLCTCPFS
jgi:hypothetical protein